MKTFLRRGIALLIAVLLCIGSFTACAEDVSAVEIPQWVIDLIKTYAPQILESGGDLSTLEIPQWVLNLIESYLPQIAGIGNDSNEDDSKPSPTPTPQQITDRVTLHYRVDGKYYAREETYTLKEMRSELGGYMVLLRNSCMDDDTDCDMTIVYEAMDFMVLKGAIEIDVPMTDEQLEIARSWNRDEPYGMLDDNKHYKLLFPTLRWFGASQDYDHDGRCSLNIHGFEGNEDYEGAAAAIVKARAEAIRIVKNMLASCSTDTEKLEYLYGYITHNVYYFDDTANPEDYYKYSNGGYVQLLYDALIRRETVCAGFAYAFAYLCELAGIDAQYVPLRETNEKKHDSALGGHVAVIAKAYGSYHWFDPTWDCGRNKKEFEYFGLSDRELFQNHYGYHETQFARSLYPDCPYSMH